MDGQGGGGGGGPWVPVAWGELFDKITILTIKARRIADPARHANVERELALLSEVRRQALVAPPAGIAEIEAELAAVNEELWTIEDEIRRLDRAGEFGPAFVALARAVYRTNDRRAALKRRIDELTGSPLREEKWYPDAPAASGG